MGFVLLEKGPWRAPPPLLGEDEGRQGPLQTGSRSHHTQDLPATRAGPPSLHSCEREMFAVEATQPVLFVTAAQVDQVLF